MKNTCKCSFSLIQRSGIEESVTMAAERRRVKNTRLLGDCAVFTDIIQAGKFERR